MTGTDPVVREVALDGLRSLEHSGHLTLTAFRLPVEFTPDHFVMVGRSFTRIEDATHWWVGDMIVQAEGLWGHDAHQHIEDAFGHIPEASRAQYATVAERIPPARRKRDLSWTHHRVVYKLDPEEQDTWLGRALEAGWSKRELEQHIRDMSEEPEKPRGGLRPLVADVIMSAEEGDDHFVVPRAPFERLRDAFGVIDGG